MPEAETPFRLNTVVRKGVGRSSDECSVGDTARIAGPKTDVAEAEAAIERLGTSGCCGCVLFWCGAHRDDAAYAQFRDCYRDMARTLGFEGHIAWAEAMP